MADQPASSSPKLILVMAAPATAAAVLAAGWAMDLLSASMLVAGLVLLVLGAEWLVHGSVVLARLLGISPMVIGLTVVAFGTSAPELATGIADALTGDGSVNIGNVIGSNIANVGVVLAITAIIRPLACHASAVRREVPIMVAVTLVAIGIVGDETVSRLEGGVLLAALGTFTLWSYRVGRREGSAFWLVDDALDPLAVPARGRAVLGQTAALVAGLALLTGGAWMLIRGATGVAGSLGVPTVVIGATIVALGTSVPELATSVVAVRRGQPDIALGNVLGSNVFNVLCVLGVTALVRPIPVPASVLELDLWIMLGFALLCLPIIGTRFVVTRLEGCLLFAVYLVYAAVLYV